MIVALVVVAAVILVGFLLFRFNGAWIYLVWDRATRNPTDRLPEGYDLPRYYRLKENGDLDMFARWPGWDGWYFFLLPDGDSGPVQMARASLMTGLYGLDGIDNYERLKFRLSTFDAVESLSLMPMFVRTPAGFEKRNNLSQQYLPRNGHLRMNPYALDVSITGQRTSHDEEPEEFGRVTGKWPHYRLRFCNPEGDIVVDLEFTGEKVVWWADAAGLFTYFSTLGRFAGTLTLRAGSAKPEPHKIPAGEETYSVKGSGALEHGFARSMFAADRLFLPVRLLNRIVPSFRPIRYHYETFIGATGERGGFMNARAFGVPVRDRGGLFLDGTYVPIHGVRITYQDDPPPDLVAAHCPDRPPVAFYRKWRVEAKTGDGVLEYTGIREFPPADVASNMTYYHFAYEGSYQGRTLKGRGYGEYVHI